MHPHLFSSILNCCLPSSTVVLLPNLLFSTLIFHSHMLSYIVIFSSVVFTPYHLCSCSSPILLLNTIITVHSQLLFVVFHIYCAYHPYLSSSLVFHPYLLSFIINYCTPSSSVMFILICFLLTSSVVFRPNKFSSIEFII